ncbi:MAG: RdgB/HAM1 family non-canonical purine NTP pyrophosphatase [Candidatus Acetothermia bacterium]|jgi:XTP/dITP diphosphohydrolase|nr:RdgB/HAM1 family non-canonical purine NTP pyrophosphatase [Candidatus Acetothermia bacterium]MDH7505834.1 RdgB/HAM1 family non-canonical purine NTP pyrophosphatase [Candidatus Acetothermia bacterium]
MELLLGTKNPGKIAEIKEILQALPELRLLTCEEIPFSEVAERGGSFAENARLKARRISQETGLPVLAEDSGLEVEALGGQPGVRSARFASERASDEENIAKLLRLLEGVANRRARFRTVAVLRFPNGRELTAEGQLEGEITVAPRGEFGFGYDPVFIPRGFSQTLAELGPEVKNKISHRRRALERVVELLREAQ